MSDQFYKDEINRELLLNIQIEKNLYAVLPKMNFSKQFISPTTQEMIDDYKQQFKKDNKQFNFPEFKPELDVITLERVYSDAEINDINDELDRAIKRITKIDTTEIPRVEKIKKQQLERFNTSQDTTVINDSKARIMYLDEEFKKLDKEASELYTYIRTLQNELLENQTRNESNIAKQTTKQQNDRRQLKDYNETIRQLNFGMLNPVQSTTETEDEYLNRLQMLSQQEEDPSDAILFNISELKKNLKTIINKEWLVESIIKSISPDDRYLLNMSFAGFKKEFTETYGINNKQLILDDYLFFIRIYLEGKYTKPIDSSIEEPIVPIEEPIGDPIEEEPIGDYKNKPIDPFIIKAQRPFRKSTIKKNIPKEEPIDEPIIKQISNMPNFENINVSVKDNGVLFSNASVNLILKPFKGSKADKRQSSEIIKYSINELGYKDIERDTAKRKTFGSKFGDILTEAKFSNVDKKLLVNAIKSNAKKPIPNYNKLYKLLDEYINQSSSVEGSGIKKRKNKIIVKKGKSLKEIDKYCQFGRNIILLNKLYYQNILSIKDKNGINVQGIPNQKVSDEFVDIIMKICDDKGVNTEKLNEEELILFSVLISKSKLNKDYNIDIKKSISLLKSKLELIEGEIQAGNDNDKLKKQLYDIVFKLSNIGVISISAARRYYNETIKLYFNK